MLLPSLAWYLAYSIEAYYVLLEANGQAIVVVGLVGYGVVESARDRARETIVDGAESQIDVEILGYGGSIHVLIVVGKVGLLNASRYVRRRDACREIRTHAVALVKVTETRPVAVL